MNLDDEAIGRFSIKAWLSTLSDKKSESFYFAYPSPPPVVDTLNIIL